MGGSTKKKLATFKATMPTKVKAMVKESVSTEIVIASIKAKAKIPFGKLKKIDKIKSKEDLEIASNQVKILKELAKESKRQREEITDSLYAGIEKIEQLFEPFESQVKVADTDTKQKIAEYWEETQKQIAQVQQDFKSGKIKKISTFTEKTNELQIVSTGSAKLRKVTKLFITNRKKIPTEYLVPDEKKIEEALKDGKVVPGAELRKVNSIAI